MGTRTGRRYKCLWGSGYVVEKACIEVRVWVRGGWQAGTVTVTDKGWRGGVAFVVGRMPRVLCVVGTTPRCRCVMGRAPGRCRVSGKHPPGGGWGRATSDVQNSRISRAKPSNKLPLDRANA
eukprot:358082-Chlamydomonas_euryale.AAC.2